MTAYHISSSQQAFAIGRWWLCIYTTSSSRQKSDKHQPNADHGGLISSFVSVQIGGHSWRFGWCCSGWHHRRSSPSSNQQPGSTSAMWLLVFCGNLLVIVAQKAAPRAIVSKECTEAKSCKDSYDTCLLQLRDEGETLFVSFFLLLHCTWPLLFVCLPSVCLHKQH